MSIWMEHQQPKRKDYWGQSLIEMALMLPFLLVLILGGLELGRLFFAKTVVTNAAREGAYYLSTHPQDFNVDTGEAPNTTLAAEQEANNSGIPDVVVTVGDPSEEGGEGWGWEGGCVGGEEMEGFESVKVTVQTNVANVVFLSIIGNVFSLGTTTYDEFPVSSCVEMLVP